MLTGMGARRQPLIGPLLLQGTTLRGRATTSDGSYRDAQRVGTQR